MIQSLMKILDPLVIFSILNIGALLSLFIPFLNSSSKYGKSTTIDKYDHISHTLLFNKHSYFKLIYFGPLVALFTYYILAKYNFTYQIMKNDFPFILGINVSEEDRFSSISIIRLDLLFIIGFSLYAKIIRRIISIY